LPGKRDLRLLLRGEVECLRKGYEANPKEEGPTVLSDKKGGGVGGGYKKKKRRPSKVFWPERIEKRRSKREADLLS